MPEDTAEYFNLTTIEDTYFISAEGLSKKSVEDDLFNQMKILIDENSYREYHVLSQGEIGRTILKPTLEMNVWVKFFKSEEDYEKFVKTYDPFKKSN